MTNDKILMELIVAIGHTLDSRQESKDKAARILIKVADFLKGRNPEETKYSSVVSRAKKEKTK